MRAISISLLFLIFAASARAEVITVIPTNAIVLDQPLQTIDLDIDANGETDLQFFYDVYLDEPFLHINVPAALQSLNRVTVTGEQNQFAKELVDGLASGVLVSENSQFNGAIFGNGPLLAQPTFAGDDILEGAGKVYVGVQFARNGELHFGWIELLVNGAGTRVTISGYAWESVALRPIMTGLGAGVDDKPASDVKVRQLGERLFEVTSDEPVSRVLVYDVLGRKVAEGGSLVDLRGLTNGTYYLQAGSSILPISLP